MKMLAAYRDQQWRAARELVAICRKFYLDLAQLYDF